jgi:hypothetical protein
VGDGIKWLVYRYCIGTGAGILLLDGDGRDGGFVSEMEVQYILYL